MNTEARRTNLLQRLLNSWWLSLFVGMAFIGLGLAAIITLYLVSKGFALVLGIVLLVAAFLLGVLVMNSSRPTMTKIVDGLVALLCLGAGIFLLINTAVGPTIVALVVGVFLPAEGIFKVATAVQMRNMPKWGWILASGLVSFGLGSVIWLYGFREAAQVTGLLLGLDLMFMGLVIISVAGALRSFNSTAQHTPA